MSKNTPIYTLDWPCIPEKTVRTIFSLTEQEGVSDKQNIIREQGYSTKRTTGEGTPPALGCMVLMLYSQKETNP